MLLWSEPYFTYSFGSMDQTLARAKRTDFFGWFHLEESERKAEKPGGVVRFRPSGPKFHDLCYLDILQAAGGEMLRMELVLRRWYIESRDAGFAQDIGKGFLLAALPQACQSVLQEFMGDIANLPSRKGDTAGFQVFRGTQSAWSAETGWSRLTLANLNLPEGPTFVVQLGPKPSAPNARLIQQ